MQKCWWWASKKRSILLANWVFFTSNPTHKYYQVCIKLRWLCSTLIAWATNTNTIILLWKPIQTHVKPLFPSYSFARAFLFLPPHFYMCCMWIWIWLGWCVWGLNRREENGKGEMYEGGGWSGLLFPSQWHSGRWWKYRFLLAVLWTGSAGKVD